MAIAQDNSTPGAFTGSATSASLTVTSSSFSPPSPSMVVAIVSCGHGPTSPSFSISDSGSHSWNTGPSLTSGNNSVVIYWVYLPSGASGITVSAKNSSSESQAMQMDVRVLTGINSVQTGAGSNTTNASSTSWTGNLTTTTVNSWVMVAVCGQAEEASITPNANTTTLNNFQASGGSSLLSGEQASPTSSPGSTAFGWTEGGSAVNYAWGALEILPAAPASVTTDIPVIAPGTTWLHQFKPWLPKPHTPAPPFFSTITSAGSFALAGVGFAGQVNQSSPDQLQVNPGPVWLSLYKPWTRPRPFIPIQSYPRGAGGIALGPLGFSATVSQTSTDVPLIQPGPAWLHQFKPQWPKPRPPVPQPVPPPPLFVVGAIALGSISFSGGPLTIGYMYIGHYSVTYLDYVDTVALTVLNCSPGGFYLMTPVSSRRGLTVPPSDGRWLGTPGLGDEIIFFAVDHATMMTAGRTVNANLQARLARGEKIADIIAEANRDAAALNDAGQAVVLLRSNLPENDNEDTSTENPQA